MDQTLTVNLPGELYARIKTRADKASRSVAQEAVALLEAYQDSQGPDASLPGHLQQTLAALDLLDNAALENAGRSHLAAELAAELESLHAKQQREGLTAPEEARCAELIAAYERCMLLRAHAATLLKKRGLDISCLGGLL